MREREEGDRQTDGEERIWLQLIRPEIAPNCPQDRFKTFCVNAWHHPKLGSETSKFLGSVNSESFTVT